MSKIENKPKITWNDIRDYGVECNKKYGLNQSQLESHLRTHLDGASSKERREVYQEFYGKRK